MIAHHIGPIASALVPNITGIFTPVALTLANPGAESGNVSWTFTANITTTNVNQTNGTIRTGTRMFWNSVTGTRGNMSQTIAIPVGQQFGVDNFAYNLVFNRYVNCVTTGAGGTWMQFDFLDASGAMIDRERTIYRTCTQNVWTLQTETVLVPPGTCSIKVWVMFDSQTANTSKLYVEDMDCSLVQVANTAKIEQALTSIVMGSRLDGVAVREANLYAVFGASQTELRVRDAKAYFILTP